MVVNPPHNTSLASPTFCADNSSLYPVIFKCTDEHQISAILIMPLMFIGVLLIFPVSIFILWTGFRQWTGSVAEPTTHTDVFTYCMAAVDVGCILGLVFYFLNFYVCKLTITLLAYHSLIFSYTGQTIFHVLTCVERYMAVVHPITYMSMKQVQWVRIRDAGIGCVFLFCFAMVGYAGQMLPMFPSDVMCCTMALVVVVVWYCTVAVFCALRRPGVGNDESKRRAFHTVVAITVVLLIRFAGQCFSVTLFHSGEIGDLNYCVSFLSGCWLCLPSNLVLPVLFLQKRIILNQLS